MLNQGLKRQSLTDLLPESLVTDLVLIGLFALAIGVFAQITIPLSFTPVPITGQTFAVLLGGAALGMRRAAIGSLLYLGLGLVGIPWFAGTAGGLQVATSPSFGYLVGFVAAAAVVGYLAEVGMDRKVGRTAIMMVVGNLVIYGFGLVFLMLDLHIGLTKGLALGVTPFLLGDLIKLVLAAGLLPGAWYLRGRLTRGREA
ncbi:MAG: biotin transporter BioY [Ferrimicrobium sp.]|uniref:Biotin transporter n=1 Tax=Ferrimicrobium acidiphilum TaxID=121039 RepID=A0ABV3Y2T2_9ACTN|nr:biotin transporter BioY [Ferrimicrobium sp.]MCL5974002.1 biotin transporter BioY [Actinomycetota bacterium]